MRDGRYPMSFDRFGGTLQLRIRCAADLRALDALEDPFWMATSAPSSQLRCDPALLRALDPEESGRLRSGAVREAARWMLRVLKDTGGVDRKAESLDVEALDGSHEEGRRLRDAARMVLEGLGAPPGRLTVEQVRNREAILARGERNGDGIIPAECVADADVRGLVLDMIATTGWVPDAGGLPGVDREILARFRRAMAAFLALPAHGAGPAGSPFPLGARTAEAHALFHGLAPWIDGYFSLAAFEEYTSSPAVPIPPEIRMDEAARDAYLAKAPLLSPTVPGRLPLDRPVNPLVLPAMRRLREEVLPRVLGPSFDGRTLTLEGWRELKAAFGAYEAWLEANGNSRVESLGGEKLERYRDRGLLEALELMIGRDAELADEADSLQKLETLILLQRWILDLCNNFVNFSDLYRPDRWALFEAGVLVMDGRTFRLNLTVQDPAAHSAYAKRSGIYLVYSRIEAPGREEPFSVVTPVTAVGAGRWAVGKRGVFYGLDGRERDARVVLIVENPVSLREAVSAPFRRIASMLSAAVERFGANAEKQIEAGLAQPASLLGQNAVKAAAGPGAGAGRLRDMLLSGGVVLAAVGSSFAFVAKTVSEMQWDQVLIALAVGAAILLLPGTILGAIRLRVRDMAPLLEASGWAVNGRMRLTGRLCRVFSPPPVRPRFPLRGGIIPPSRQRPQGLSAPP